MKHTLTINDRKRNLDAPAEIPLLWALRNDLGLVGTKFGCGAGLCGACTVHIDGEPARACQTTLGEIGARKVTTIEQIGATPTGARLQQAWIELDVPQCGYCQAGQIMSAAALLKQSPKPSRAEIAGAMNGNICRCATYDRIVRAVELAAGGKG